MINDYIQQLIQSNSRVIVPDLGAFMIQDTPEGKVISFNDFLKFNDGMLVNKIVVNEHIDTTKSKEQIKAYVKEVENTLKKGEKFAIDGVGFLVKSDRGDIVFEQDANAGVSSKTETKSAKTKKIKTETTNKPTAEVTNDKVTEEQPVKIENTTQISDNKTDNIVEVESAAIEQINKNEPEVKPKTENVNNQINNSFSKTNKQNNEMEIKTKNKTLNIVLIVVSALIIIGAIVWAVINFNLIGRFRPAQQPVEEPVIVDTLPAVDTTAVDSTTIEPEPEPIVEEQPAVDNSSYYYIVAGSFQNHSYAESFEQQMKDAGFDAHTVQNGSFYCVGLKRFATEREAYNELRVIMVENPNLWILYK